MSAKGYVPRASPPPGQTYWKIPDDASRIENSDLAEQWVEIDLLGYIKLSLDLLITQDDFKLESRVSKLLQRDEGLRAFYAAVWAKLEDSDLNQDGKDRVMEQSVRTLGSRMFRFKKRPLKEAKRHIGNPRIAGYRDFLARFSQLYQTYQKLDTIFVSVSFSSEGNLLASGLYDGSFHVWDINYATSTQIGQPPAQRSRPVLSVAFAPDGKRIASGSYDNTICLWNMERMDRIGDSWKGHTGHVGCIAFSPDGTKVVSGSYDETLRLWDSETGKEIAVMKGHKDWVLSVAFSPDAKHIVSGSADKSVHIWDAHTYHMVAEPLTGHTSSITSVVYSPDGRYIAFGSLQTIHIWDAEKLVQVGKPLHGHTYYINSVCFSPDGELLASGSPNSTIRIWNTNTGEQVGEGLSEHDDWVQSVAFSPDGKILASASYDCIIKTWDINGYLELSLLSTA